MEFIPPISNPAHSPLKVPWFSPPDKLYKPGGYREWLFYPHYEGYNIQHIAEGDFHGKTWTEAAGFLQRWAYWGTIVEVLQIGGLLGQEKRCPSDEEQLQSFSAALPYLLMVWHCIKTDPENPNCGKIELERFLKITVILKRVNVLFSMLCQSEVHRLRSQLHQDQTDGKPPKAQLAYARHSHEHEVVVDWDQRFAERPSETTFFSEEPRANRSDATHELESPGHALLLSIGTVGELLQKATEQKYERNIEGLKWKLPLTIVRRVHYAGWCNSWLRRFNDEGSIIRAYYLSAISKGPLGRHSHCCAFGCIANRVNPLTYQMSHRVAGCSCPIVPFEVNDKSLYANWIESGHTPLLVRNGSSWELIRSHESQASKPRKYVAISHVWMDGTGSRDGNSLYSCQLDKFQAAATELCHSRGGTEGPVPFWVDTISVPYDKGPLKMQALRQMEQVYREADSVLVFDSGLQQVPLRIPAQECLSRIEISSWNERLWTIQEAVFAKKLYFKFQDGIVSLQELMFRYRIERFARLGNLRFGPGADSLLRGMPMLRIILDGHLEPVLKKEEHANGELCDPTGRNAGGWLAMDSDALNGPVSETEMDGLKFDTIFLGTIVAVSNFFSTLRESQSASEIAQVKWSSLERVLPYRQTSVASDEGLCMATLLGMNLKTLYDLKDEERIRQMFLHIGTISPSILFGDRPRLDKEGCRWMPTSFYGQRIEKSERLAQVTESGVTATLPSLSVTFPPVSFMLDVEPGGTEGPYGFIQLRGEDRGHLVARSFPLQLSGTGAVFNVISTLPDDTPGMVVPSSKVRIMLERPLPEADVEAGSSLVKRVLHDWEKSQQKSIIEGFLVQMKNQWSREVEYTIPVTLSRFHGANPRQVAAAAQATQTEDIEWLIT